MFISPFLHFIQFSLIHFTKHILSNGLKAVINEDWNTPLVTVAISYNAGAKYDPDSNPGLAHLFEHLMFSGSKNAPSYDDPLHLAGGDGNAFTNSDITCYYATLPANNIDIPLFLEADRMAGLKLNQKSLNTQKKVVIEEFQETCLNEPYGDVWHHLLPMSYQKHPYRFPVIGNVIEDIKSVTLPIAQEFYEHYYSPNHAVISISGAIKKEDAIAKVEKYFGQIKPSALNIREETTLSESIAFQKKYVASTVPTKAIYMTYQMGARLDKQYYAADLFSDALAYGKSSLLYKRLVKEQKLFTEIDSYLTGTNEPGLMVIEGRLNEKITFEQAEIAIKEGLEFVLSEGINERHLQLLKNRAESNLYLSEVGTANKAILLSQYELLGDANLLNQEIEAYATLEVNNLMDSCNEIVGSNHVATLWYGE
jgi:zinc protease